MADLEYSVGLSGVSETLDGLSSIARAQTTTARAATTAGGAMARSSTEAATALRSTTQAATEMTQRSIEFTTKLSGAANAVQSLVGQLGIGGRQAGLVGAMTAASAAGAQLGGMFGPGGALVGGILGAAIPAFAALRSSMDETVIASQELAEETTRLQEIQARGDAQRRQQIEREITSGRILTLSQEEITRARILREDDLREASEALATFESEMARTDPMSERYRRASDDAGEYRLQISALIQELGNLGQAEGRLINPNQGRQPGATGRAPARRRGGGRRSADDFSGRELDRLDAEAVRAKERATGDLDRLMTGATGDGADPIASIANDPSSFTQAFEEAEEKAISLREAQQDLALAAVDAAKTFETSWRGGLEGVRDAWEMSNRALADSGQEMMDMGDLLAMSFRSVGDDIATSIGEEMTGAFRQAVSAWLDGSKSFIEAAEEMAKGVIQALTVEAIVQAVVSVARAISAFAGQDYAGGVQHLAAAAAWGAVGVVAGGVGAAVGAFGGGGGNASASAEQGDRQAAPSDVREGGQTNLTFIIQPGVVSTSAEVSAGVMQALETAAREGYSLPPRMLPAR